MPSKPAKTRTKTPLDEAAGRHVQILRECGLRVTPVRLAILRIMEAAPSALHAQEIFDRVAASEGVGTQAAARKSRGGEDASARPDRVTVYRTLNALVGSGIAHKVDPGDRVFRFSLTDHARCTHEHHVHEHPHFVCDTCGKVECLQDTEVVIHSRSQHAHGHAKDAAAALGTRMKVESVMLRGTCGQCAR